MALWVFSPMPIRVVGIFATCIGEGTIKKDPALFQVRGHLAKQEMAISRSRLAYSLKGVSKHTIKQYSITRDINLKPFASRFTLLFSRVIRGNKDIHKRLPSLHASFQMSSLQTHLSQTALYAHSTVYSSRYLICSLVKL